jgi:hypothetical protein
MLLVLGIGVGAISWWGVRLGYPAHLIFLAVVLATLSPAMLHTHSHTHYAGLFRRVRNFWAPLNDLSELNQRGLDLMEVSWLCRERVLESGALRGDVAELFRMLGVDYVATRGEVIGVDLRSVRANTHTSVYEFAAGWPDVVFIEGVRAQEVSDYLMDLVGGRFVGSEFEILHRELPSRRVSNHEWVVEVPEELRTRSGTVFMNHPIEYHRDLRVLGMPTEAYWAIRSVSLPQGQGAFGLHEAPFRMMTMDLPDSFSIVYSLSHYKLWGGLSIFCLSLVLGTVMYYGRWERRSAAESKIAP